MGCLVVSYDRMLVSMRIRFSRQYTPSLTEDVDQPLLYLLDFAVTVDVEHCKG